MAGTRRAAARCRGQFLRTRQELLVSGVPISWRERKCSEVVRTIEITYMDQVMSRLGAVVDLSEKSGLPPGPAAGRELQIEDVVAESSILAGVRETALQYATVDSTVLLVGETGAGKGLFARLIHQASARRAGPFLEASCGVVVEESMESELFGHAKGAFAGAESKGRVGLVELAHKGTLLLNEIGDLSPGLQVKLLRFLEDGEVWAIGAVRPKRPDVRIMVATSRDLAAMIAAGTFRGDLFYRLDVLCLQVPPLREHAEDIPRLVELTLSRLERKVKRRRGITPEALRALSRYVFPGNVRELLNLIERLMVTTTGDTIDVGHLPRALLRVAGEGPGTDAGSVPTLRKALQKVESQLLRDALSHYKTQALAARHLGIAQSTVARKARRYGLDSAKGAS